MENSNFNDYFNEEMTSEEALHVFVKLLKRTPKEQRDALYKAYAAVDDVILRRDCEKVKQGLMY